MKDISQELEYRDKKYKIVFNLNVMEQIQEEYGTIEKWGELTEGTKDEVNAKAVIYGFWAMLNEGIDIDNEENGTDIKPLTLKQVGRMLTSIGIEKAASQMQETVVESVGVEEQPKNE